MSTQLPEEIERRLTTLLLEADESIVNDIRTVVSDEIAALNAENAKLRAALESIASQKRPRHGEKKYWLAISHEQCAEVLVTDTNIARGALTNSPKPKG